MIFPVRNYFNKRNIEESFPIGDLSVQLSLVTCTVNEIAVAGAAPMESCYNINIRKHAKRNIDQMSEFRVKLKVCNPDLINIPPPKYVSNFESSILKLADQVGLSSLL